MDALSDPAKTFDTSGKSAALFHHHAICKTPMALPNNGRVSAIAGKTSFQKLKLHRPQRMIASRIAEPRALPMHARGDIDVNTVPDLNKATAIAATGRPKAAAAPRIRLLSHGFCIDHPDPELGEQLMAEALGVADRDAVHGILRQLVKASVKGERPDEVNLAFMISMVKSIKPRDSVEAMLVAQMVSVHVMAMRCAYHLANAARQRRARTGQVGPHVSGPDGGAQPLSQQRRACHHRAERVSRGWRQGHRRQRHAACERDRLGQSPGARGDGCPDGLDA